MMKKVAVLAASAVAATSMSACSFNASFGTDIKGSAVEQKILPELKRQTGDDGATVSCPGELKSKEGSTLSCNGTVKGKTYPINVTSKGGGKFSWTLDGAQPTTETSEEPSPEPTTTTSPEPTSSSEPSAEPTSSSNPGSLRVAKIAVENRISDMLKSQTGRTVWPSAPATSRVESAPR